MPTLWEVLKIMKSKFDPRHQKRRDIIKELFAYSFAKQDISKDSQDVLDKEEEIDKKINDAASQWPIDKLNKSDLAILRLAVYELFNTDTPPKVVIDEAVELAKEYGSESSPSFVNGVLGHILNEKEGTNEPDKN